MFSGLSLSPGVERQNLYKCIWQMSPSQGTKIGAGKFWTGQRTHVGKWWRTKRFKQVLIRFSKLAAVRKGRRGLELQDQENSNDRNPYKKR